MARDVYSIEVQNYGIAYSPSQSRQPLCIVSITIYKLFSFVLI